MEALRSLYVASAAALARGVDRRTIEQRLDIVTSELYELAAAMPEPDRDPYIEQRILKKVSSLPSISPELKSEVRPPLDIWGRPMVAKKSPSPEKRKKKLPNLSYTSPPGAMGATKQSAASLEFPRSPGSPPKLSSPKTTSPSTSLAEVPATAELSADKAESSADGGGQDIGESDDDLQKRERNWLFAKAAIMARRDSALMTPKQIAVKAFQKAANQRDQRARAAAHLIGSLRDVAKKNRGKSIGRAEFDAILAKKQFIKEAMSGTLEDDLFEAIDSDDSGHITIKELEQAVRDLLDPTVISEVEEILKLGDDVMATSIKQMQDTLSGQAARVIDLFRKWDINHDGLINREEFFRAMVLLGMTNNVPAEIEALFSAFDPDDSGEISFRELYQMIRHNPVKVERKVKKVAPRVEVLDITELRKDVKKGMLHLELRHEILLGGKAMTVPSQTGGRRTDASTSPLTSVMIGMSGAREFGAKVI